MASNHAFHGAVAVLIAAATLNATAGAAQALTGSEGTADAVTKTTEPAHAAADDGNGPAEPAPIDLIETTGTTAPAEAPSTLTPRQDGAVSAVTPQADAPGIATRPQAEAAGTTTMTHPDTTPVTVTVRAAETGRAATAAPAPLADPATPVAALNAGATGTAPPWTPARTPRPIWTRAGLMEFPRTPVATRVRVAARTPAKAAAGNARRSRAAKRAVPVRKARLQVHHRVWRTSALPRVRVWAPKTPKGRNKAIAYRLVTERSWPVTQFRCLDSLWTRESNWNHRAQNPSSGAYGIPQALPGDKMVGVGHDWRVNPATQIRWGLKYIKGRYGSPCGAWGHFRSHNWY